MSLSASAGPRSGFLFSFLLKRGFLPFRATLHNAWMRRVLFSGLAAVPFKTGVSHGQVIASV